MVYGGSDYEARTRYRGTSLPRKRPPPRATTHPWAKSYCRVVGGLCFLVSEIPLYGTHSSSVRCLGALY